MRNALYKREANKTARIITLLYEYNSEIKKYFFVIKSHFSKNSFSCITRVNLYYFSPFTCIIESFIIPKFNFLFFWDNFSISSFKQTIEEFYQVLNLYSIITVKVWSFLLLINLFLPFQHELELSCSYTFISDSHLNQTKVDNWIFYFLLLFCFF